MQGIRNRLVNGMVALVYRGGRGLILATPDFALALLVRGLRWLAYLLTGDLQMRIALTDVMEIFQDGPPGTAVVRKMIRSADLKLSRDVVRGMIGL